MCLLFALRRLAGTSRSMPRAIWSGSIVFGLVNVPARLYSAIEEHKLHFSLVHEKDGSPIGYRKVCKKEDKEVPDGEIVKAFELEKGEWVYMEDEDFEAARVEGYKTIEIVDFVPYEQIDPIFFAKTYYLGPGEDADKVYSLFLRALGDSGLMAVATFVLRDKEHLGGLRVLGKVLALEQLYWSDEVLSTDQIAGTRARVGKDELELAQRLIEGKTTAWKPERYTDTYERELKKAIEARRKGEGVHEAPAEPEAETYDLMEALRASVEASGKRRRKRAAA
jgi:DNA end-binding protein Ku